MTFGKFCILNSVVILIVLVDRFRKGQFKRSFFTGSSNQRRNVITQAIWAHEIWRPLLFLLHCQFSVRTRWLWCWTGSKFFVLILPKLKRDIIPGTQVFVVLNMKNLEFFTQKLPYVRSGTRADGVFGWKKVADRSVKLGVPNGIFFASFMIREYKNTSSAIGELYVRSRFFCNKKSHLRYRHVRAMHRATSKELRSVPNPQLSFQWISGQCCRLKKVCVFYVYQRWVKFAIKVKVSLLAVSFEKRICGQQDALGEINFVFK